MTRSTFNYRREAQVLSADSFDRAQGGTTATRLLNTDGSGLLDPLTWVKTFTAASGFGITGNVVTNGGNDVSTAHGYHAAYVDLLTATVDLSLVVTVDNQSGKSAGLLFRYVDDSNFWTAQWAALGPTVNLYKTVAGTETLVASGGSLGFTGTLRVRASGSSIAAYVPASTQVVSVTDAFNATATKHGLAMRNDPAGSLNASTLDNWLATGF